MSKTRRRKLVVVAAASAAILAVAPLSTALAEKTPDDVSTRAALECVPGGPTENDAAVAAQLNTILVGKMSGYMNAYNVSCARAVTQAVEDRGLDPRAAHIAVTTTIVETSIANLDGGDRDSVGLYQQRDTWGSFEERTDPVWATNAFLGAMEELYPDGSWMTAEIGGVCQNVQNSAYPDRYSEQAADGITIANTLWNADRKVDRDVSGDDFADILTIDGGDGKLKYYPNQIGIDPAVPFANASWASAGGTWSAAKSTTSGDVSGDGHADILSVGTDGRLYYYPNNIKVHPDAPFTGAAWKSEPTWGDVKAISAGDISGDGFADLLAIGADNRLYYYPNNIKAHPEAPFTNASWKSEPTWGGVKAISAGDISGDKHADLMAVGDDDRLYYYPNGIKTHPEAPFTGAAWKSEPTWGKVTSLYTSHISGDNHADLLAIDGDGILYYYPNSMNSGDPFTKSTWRTNPTWSENRLLG